MAIKEFEFGPNQYFADDYVDGVYIDSNVARASLALIPGLIIEAKIDWREYITPGYFEDEYVEFQGARSSFVIEGGLLVNATISLVAFGLI
jgi:hypothetical protein